jgi:hypothetical protein
LISIFYKFNVKELGNMKKDGNNKAKPVKMEINNLINQQIFFINEISVR